MKNYKPLSPKGISNVAVVILLLSPFAASAADPKLDSPQQQAAPTAFAAPKPTPKLTWGVGDGKSFLIPAADIFGFDFLLNQFNRNFIDRKAYGSTFSSIKKNLSSKWVVDDDPFSINQFGHPYQGSMYFGFARSAGLNYWQSLAYTEAGSAFWEIAGETTPPSINDQFTTGLGGTLLGEPLFRMSSLLLESGSGPPGFWRELGAALISPATGFNRLAFGNRFDGVFASHDPAVYTLVQIGYNLNASVHSDVNANPDTSQPPIPQGYRKGQAILDFNIAYGLPGKPGYTYTRPFDYFNFEATAVTGSAIQNILSRGLLYGTDYAVGKNYRGIWGLYGVYNYISPQIFRVSTTALAVGTTGQWWLSDKITLQGTVLAGLGYGSAGSIRGHGTGDYHNGIDPQELISTRLIFGDRVELQADVRDYYVGGLASKETSGAENIARAEVSLTVRVYGLNAITLKYTASRRDAHEYRSGSINQSVDAISIGYSYLGQTHFGAVDWRPSFTSGL